MSKLLEYLDPARTFETLLPSALLKATCEDFRVEELPSYEPSGEGTHLFLWVQKRNVSAGHLLKVLSTQLKVSQRDIGVAGQKDRRAITTQYVSVPSSCQQRVDAFQDEQIQILKVIPHGNKLRTGHVAGNRFRIALRPTDKPFTSVDCDQVSERLLLLSQHGFPNYYGPQRFRHDASSVTKGIQLLSASSTQKKALRMSRFERKMLLSAAQSAVFNLVASQRVTAGTAGTAGQPMDGDVVCRRGGIRPFLYSQRNAGSNELLIPMGPMPGIKMVPAQAEVLLAEQHALQSLDLTWQHFNRKKDTPGARRPMLAWPTNCLCELLDNGALLLRFDLPSGSYATVLLREIVQEQQMPDVA